jgi:hypothetical protein
MANVPLELPAGDERGRVADRRRSGAYRARDLGQRAVGGDGPDGARERETRQPAADASFRERRHRG